MSGLRLLCGLLMVAGVEPSAWAVVTWENTAQTVVVPLGAATATATYRFTNIGPEAVAITSTTSSCGCTVASTQEKSFAVRESGEVLITFSFGSRRGLHQQTASVIFTDARGSVTPYDLNLTVDIPDPRQVLTLSHQVLAWMKGSPINTKDLLLSVTQQSDIAITGVEVTDDHFSVQAEATTPGRRYRIAVTPKSTAETHATTLTIVTDSTMDRFKRIPITVVISEPAESSP
jgi:hypothetical protein